MKEIISASCMVIGIICCLSGAVLYGIGVFAIGVWIHFHDEDDDDMYGGPTEISWM